MKNKVTYHIEVLPYKGIEGSGTSFGLLKNPLELQDQALYIHYEMLKEKKNGPTGQVVMTVNGTKHILGKGKNFKDLAHIGYFINAWNSDKNKPSHFPQTVDEMPVEHLTVKNFTKFRDL